MKKSKQVPASLIVAVAGLSLGACSSGSAYDCVDAAGNVLTGNGCQTTPGAHYIRRVSTGGFGGSGYSGGFFGG